MRLEEFQRKHLAAFQGFLGSEMGKDFQLTLMSERDRSHLTPTGGIQYTLTELASAQFNREKGWDAMFFLIRAMASAPVQPKSHLVPDYGIPEPKTKAKSK